MVAVPMLAMPPVGVPSLPARIQASLIAVPELNEPVSLYTHLAVRDDAHLLYGFVNETERALFRTLLKVNGVGTKMALVILSGMDAAGIHRAIFEGDTAGLSKLPGIGKKTAERLVVELRDRLDGLSAPAVTAPGAGTSAGSDRALATAPTADPVAEAVNALIALGLKPPEASRRVAAIDSADLACEEIVRLALKAMVK